MSGPGARGLALAALMLAPAVARGDGPRVHTRFEAGAEYDSNVRRAEAPELVHGGPLMRARARLRVDAAPAQRHAAQLTAIAGGKRFLTAAGDDEDVAVLAGNLRYDVGLPARRAIVGAHLDYYDALGSDQTVRNFRNLDGELALQLVGPQAHRVGLAAGYRSFDYAREAGFDWDGQHASLRYTTTLWQAEGDPDEASAIDVAAAYRVELRDYAGPAFRNVCPSGGETRPECYAPIVGIGREDLYHRAQAELVYTGDRVYAARYELQVADSNSEGQSLVRHRGELSITAELPGAVYATARGVLQYIVFSDPLLLSRDVEAQTFVTIEDENRNAFVLHLARDLSPRWTIEAQYAIYSNEFAAGQELDFRRQTAYLGTTFTL